MTDTENTSEPKALPPPQRRVRLSRGTGAAGALAVVLIAGAALGAGGTRLAQNWQPRSVMLLQPAPIDKMAERSPVAIKGDVAEIFGNKFVVQDGSGRALVDTGPRGEDRMVVPRARPLPCRAGSTAAWCMPMCSPMPMDATRLSGRPTRAHGPKGPKGPKDGPGARADRGPPPPPDRDAPTRPAAASAAVIQRQRTRA